MRVSIPMKTRTQQVKISHRRHCLFCIAAPKSGHRNSTNTCLGAKGSKAKSRHPAARRTACDFANTRGCERRRRFARGRDDLVFFPHFVQRRSSRATPLLLPETVSANVRAYCHGDSPSPRKFAMDASPFTPCFHVEHRRKPLISRCAHSQCTAH